MTSRRTKISPKSGRGLGHVTSTIFGSTVGYPSDSLASCLARCKRHNYCSQTTPSIAAQFDNADQSLFRPVVLISV